VPGSHVIVRWQQPAEEDDPETIEAAAALAGWYSSVRQGGSAEIDVARRRHVRKISGGGPGMVTYRNEYTIAVQPENEETLRESGKLG
jgi:predicted ribosome quality control (RQC) complex YloA/Tae2 family protein